MTAPWQCPQCRVWWAPTVQKCECAAGPSPKIYLPLDQLIDRNPAPGSVIKATYADPNQQVTSHEVSDNQAIYANDWIKALQALIDAGMPSIGGSPGDRAVEFIKAMHADRKNWNDIRGFIMSIGGPSDNQDNAKWQIAYVGELFTKLKYAQCPWEKYRDCVLEQAARVCEKPGKSLGDSDSHWGPEYARRIRLLKSPEESP